MTTTQETHRIIVSESNSSTTAKYRFTGTDAEAIAEAKRHLAGCHVGEGWVRVDDVDGSPIETLRA